MLEGVVNINLSKRLKDKRDAEYRRNQSRSDERLVIDDDGQTHIEGDYLTQAVESLNNLQGHISLAEGENITLEVIHNQIVISSSGEQSGGLTDIPQATDTELGGIIAENRTDENVEVKIEPTTGRLYVPTPNIGDVDGLIPPGGNTGQVLVKVDGTDYNVTWMNPPVSEGSTLSQIDFFKISDVVINESLTLTNIDIPEGG